MKMKKMGSTRSLMPSDDVPSNENEPNDGLTPFPTQKMESSVEGLLISDGVTAATGGGIGEGRLPADHADGRG